MDTLLQIVVAVLTFNFDSFNAYAWLLLSLNLLVGFKFAGWFSSSKYIWNDGSLFHFDLIPSNKIQKDDDLDWSDYLYTTINRCFTTTIYVYHATIWIKKTEKINWSMCVSINEIMLSLVAFFLLFVIYDLIYVTFHRTLHIPSIYPYIHKHHHKQISPFRGTYDGVNTHPFEYFVGTYLHLWSIIILTHIYSFFNINFVNYLSIFAFLGMTSIMASTNHTRYAINIPYFYDVRDHDVHHRFPRSNYGQFINWWDRVFGSFTSYDDLNNRQKRKT